MWNRSLPVFLQKWLEDLTESSCVTWRVSRTWPEGLTNLFKQRLYCQHACNHPRKGSRTTKTTGCTALLFITVHRLVQHVWPPVTVVGTQIKSRKPSFSQSCMSVCTSRTLYQNGMVAFGVHTEVKLEYDGSKLLPFSTLYVLPNSPNEIQFRWSKFRSLPLEFRPSGCSFWAKQNVVLSGRDWVFDRCSSLGQFVRIFLKQYDLTTWCFAYLAVLGNIIDKSDFNSKSKLHNQNWS